MGWVCTFAIELAGGNRIIKLSLSISNDVKLFEPSCMLLISSEVFCTLAHLREQRHGSLAWDDSRVKLKANQRSVKDDVQ